MNGVVEFIADIEPAEVHSQIGFEQGSDLYIVFYIGIGFGAENGTLPQGGIKFYTTVSLIGGLGTGCVGVGNNTNACPNGIFRIEEIVEIVPGGKVVNAGIILGGLGIGYASIGAVTFFGNSKLVPAVISSKVTK